MKGLIVDEPWIGLILRGNKTWEMRKGTCHHRGLIALIRKGSGCVVGTAEIVASLPRIESTRDYAEAEPYHWIPPERQAQTFADGWRTPWVLRNAHTISEPVPYKHPPGAVIWVNLDAEVERSVWAQLEVESARSALTMSSCNAGTPEPSLTQRPAKRECLAAAAQSGSSRVPISGPDVPAGTVRIVTVTGGNIRNNHIYLPLDFFPADAIGGSNKSEAARRTIRVTFTPGRTIETDIDRTKRILRDRSAVGDFFARAGVREGNAVRLASTGPHSYEISKADA